MQASLFQLALRGSESGLSGQGTNRKAGLPDLRVAGDGR